MSVATASGSKRSNGKPAGPTLHDAEAERILIGSILAAGAPMLEKVSPLIGANSFFLREHADLYRHLLGVHVEGGPFDAGHFITRLRAAGDLARLQSALESCIDSTPISIHGEAYAATVKRYADLRRLDALSDSIKAGLRSGESVVELSNLVHFETERIAEGGSPTGPRFNRITAADLAAQEFHLEYVVENIRVCGQPGNILGPSKTLKTGVMLDEAISVATATPFLGKFEVPYPKRVLVMTGESGMSTIKETCSRICEARFLELADLDNLIFSDTIPKIANAAHLTALAKMLKGDAIDILYIDPLYLALDAGGSEGSLFAMGAMLRGISELCQSCNVTLVMLHHLKKANGPQAGPADLADASWSGTAEFARQWSVLSRRKPYEGGTGVHELWMNVGGSAGHSGLYSLTIDEGVGHGNRHWDVTVEFADEVRKREADEREEKEAVRKQRVIDGHAYKLREALKVFPDGETAKALRDRARLSAAAINEAIDVLRRRGELDDVVIVKAGKRHTGIKIRKPWESSGSAGLTGTTQGSSPGVPLPGDGAGQGDGESL